MGAAASIKGLFRRSVVVVSSIAAWYVVSSLRLVDPLFLPSPSATGAALAQMLVSDGTIQTILATLYRAFAGLGLAIAVGIPVGVLMGRVSWLYSVFEFPIEFFRAIPSSALFFLFILVFGIGNASKIAVVFYGCSLVILISTIYGAQPTKEKDERVRMLQTLGAKRHQVLYLATLPDALPHIMSGIRVCISLALVLVIVTEMFLGGSVGIGRDLYDAYLAYRVADMYALIIILGMLGYVCNRIFLIIERRVCHWTVVE